MVSVSSPSHVPAEAQPFDAALGTAGYRQTGPRREVARLFAARDGHFTAADLLHDARYRRSSIGRATVFRALELFTELQLLERIDLPAGGHAYVRCRPRDHHHHLVCERCGRVTEVGELGLAAVIEGIPARTGWQVAAHRLELYGRCPRCQGPPTTRETHP